MFEELTKVELHLHLEGAIPLSALWELIRKYGGALEVPDIHALDKRFQYKDFPQFIDTWQWKNGFLREYDDFTLIAGAVAADLAIAKESAGFTMAYTNAGLAPDGSSTFFLPRRIGDRRARELMLTNRMLTAAEAVDWGVINQAVPDAEFDETVATLAARLAKGPTRAFGAVKSMLNETFEHGLESQMELEARAISSMAETADGREGIAAFLEKRKPEFNGN